MQRKNNECKATSSETKHEVAKAKQNAVKTKATRSNIKAGSTTGRAVSNIFAEGECCHERTIMQPYARAMPHTRNHPRRKAEQQSTTKTKIGYNPRLRKSLTPDRSLSEEGHPGHENRPCRQQPPKDKAESIAHNHLLVHSSCARSS